MVQTRSAARKTNPKNQGSNVKDAAHPDSSMSTPSQPGVGSNPNTVTSRLASKTTSRKRARPPEVQDGPEMLELSKKPRRYVEQNVLFVKLNMDVLIHIASCAHPSALINLARTCTFLRSFLMTKSSAFIWRDARLQLEGFPECPSDLSEQKYAHLFFYDCCHNCGDQSVEQRTYWNIRQRLCLPCSEKRLVIIQSWNWHSSGWNGILAAECIKDKWSYSRYYVDKAQLAEFRIKYNSPSKNGSSMVEEREMVQIVAEHARRCEAWTHVRLKDREDSIFERIRKLGYEAEISFEGAGIYTHYRSAFKSTLTLTDEEWNHMLPNWLEILSKIRTRRLHEVIYPSRLPYFDEEYNKYVRHPPSRAQRLNILPSTGDVAAFPPFVAVIRAPEEITKDKLSFQPAFRHLPRFVREWRKMADEAITATAKPSRGASTSIDAEVPDMAGTPHRESSPIGTGSILHHLFHVSLEVKRGRFRVLCTYPDILFLNVFQTLYPQPHDSDTSGLLGPLSVRTDMEGKHIIRLCQEVEHVVRTCGLDPEVATWEDMEKRNPRFVCLMCLSSQIPRTRTWIGALCHAEKHHCDVRVNPNGRRWRLINDDYVSLVEEMEAKGEDPPRDVYFRCLLCRPRVGDTWSSISKMISHLKDAHKVKKTEATLGAHYKPLQCIDLSSNADSMVEMIEKGDRVTFRVAAYPEGYKFT